MIVSLLLYFLNFPEENICYMILNNQYKQLLDVVYKDLRNKINGV